MLTFTADVLPATPSTYTSPWIGLGNPSWSPTTSGCSCTIIGKHLPVSSEVIIPITKSIVGIT